MLREREREGERIVIWESAFERGVIIGVLDDWLVVVIEIGLKASWLENEHGTVQSIHVCDKRKDTLYAVW
jgi:hypothetical protein